MARLPFLACAALLLALAAAYEYGVARPMGVRFGWIVYPLILFPVACILSKRLHDRGRAGWWGFPIVWALVEAWPARATPLGYVGLLILAVAFVELGLMPGEPGPNRFGPAPSRTA